MRACLGLAPEASRRRQTAGGCSSLALSFVFLFQFLLPGSAQGEGSPSKKGSPQKADSAVSVYAVERFAQPQGQKAPKNIILMIGDGMGLAHVYAAMVANHGQLYLDNFKHIGLAKTHSSSDFITDSAASATALATGVKTYNGAIGVGPDKKPLPSIRDLAEKKGLKTGLVSTSAITHATPASFIAHAESRGEYEKIAAQFLDTQIDLFIGGGLDHFEKRRDGRNLSQDLRAKGYQVVYTIADIQKVESGKLAGLTARDHHAPAPERGEMLVPATETAIRLLSKESSGFFLMVEGSQIDFLSHANNTAGVVLETLDFDRAIGAALRFASTNGETLVIVTGDHETGGMTLNGGDCATGQVTARYTSSDHTAVAVPVYAFGPGADQFTGFIDNTEIARRMMKLLNLDP
ncbi:MAG: alkaline phosphatase [Lentisphaerae bacterium]|nr:alkaline phosphatase [Lentisphaerota bacterium]